MPQKTTDEGLNILKALDAADGKADRQITTDDAFLTDKMNKIKGDGMIKALIANYLSDEYDGKMAYLADDATVKAAFATLKFEQNGPFRQFNEEESSEQIAMANVMQRCVSKDPQKKGTGFGK